MFRRAFAAVAASVVALGGLTFTAAPVAAAVSDASISPAVWQPNEQAQAVVTFDSSSAANGSSSQAMSVEVGWGWVYQHRNPSTTPDDYAASYDPATDTYTCATIGVSFASPGFATAPTTAGNVECQVLASSTFAGNPGQMVRLINTGAGGFTFSATNTVTVTFAAGTITAPSSGPASDTWRIIDVGGGSGVTVRTDVPGPDGTVAPEPVVMTLAIESNGGSCSISEITGLQGSWTTAPDYSTCQKPGSMFRGFATNQDGTGTFIYPGGPIFFLTSNRVYAIYDTPQTAGAPTDVVALAGRNQITVSWKAPADTGSSEILNYLAQANPSGRVCITRTTDADMLSCTFNLPATNTKYTFKVQALNNAGWGEFSAESAGVSPFDLFLSTAQRRQSGFFQRLIGWGSTISMNGRAPGYAPGTAVTPQWKAGDGNWVSETRAGVRVGSDNQISWSKKLKRNLNGRPITVRYAIGDVTSEEYALRIGSVVGVPAVPRNVRVNITEAQRLKVSWAAPANNGGSPITSYEVSAQLFANSAPVTCRVNADQPLTCTLRASVRGLDRQKTYAVKVTATNASGKSKPAKTDFRMRR